MGSGLITIAGIAGIAEDRMRQHLISLGLRCDELPETFSRENADEISFFFERIRSNAARPPVVFYRCYSDLWSIQHALLHHVFGTDLHSMLHAAVTRDGLPGLHLTYACERDMEATKRTTMLDLATPSAMMELRWFVDGVRDCIEVLAPCRHRSMLIAMEIFRESFDDAAIGEELESVPAWF